MTTLLWSLLFVFAQLSLLAFGGGISILPEMQRQVVDVHGWMTAREFGSLFALAQAAPGPNLMVVTLVGWHVAGPAGAVVASVGMFAPSSLLAGFAMTLWVRFSAHPARTVIQSGLLPVTAGLVAASAVLMTAATIHDALQLAIAAVAAGLSFGSRLHPLAILAGGALMGLATSF